MDRDDALLRQIDEFREKAKQLQDILNTRESKVRELQEIVYERETKASQLQSLVAEKQKEADELSEGVSRNVNVIMERVDDKLDRKFYDMNRSISEKLTDQVVKTAESTDEIKRMLEDFKSPEVDTASIVSDLKEPIEEVRETVSGIKAPIEEVKEVVSGIKEPLEKVRDAVNGVKDPIESMSKEVTGMKGEIMQKIHTEGVHVFRNTRDLIEEQGQHTEAFDEMKREMHSLRTSVKAALWFSIVTFVVLIVFVLYSLGVFNFS